MGVVMDYRATLQDLRNALRFVKPLAKVMNHLEFLSELEGKDKDLSNQISEKEKNLATVVEREVEAKAKLSSTQEGVVKDIQDIKDGITVEKETILKSYENKIELAEDELDSIVKCRETIVSDVAKLKQEKVILTKEVGTLQAAISKASASVSGIKGGE